jgi:hypothetical protein
MKPRLEPAPWTEEDGAIWRQLIAGDEYLQRCQCRAICIYQDRRDAYLMFKLTQARTALRALYRMWGPQVDGDDLDHYGDGETAVPMPRIPFNL